MQNDYYENTGAFERRQESAASMLNETKYILFAHARSNFDHSTHNFNIK